MAKRYARLNFENRPSVKTPVNDVNLNIMDKGIDDLDNAIEEIYDTELPAKAPNNHASTSGAYGLGTPANYGHVKTINNLSQSTYTDGTALSAYQGYVLDKGKLNIGEDYRTDTLINGNFSINQRGLTTYSAYGYTVDRWFFGGGLIAGQSVSKTSYGISLTSNSTNDAYLLQYIEGASKYLNKVLTLSICDNLDNTYHSSGILTTSGGANVRVSITPPGSSVEIGYAYLNYQTGMTDIFRVVIVVNIGYTLNIKWAKLEQNDHATPFIPRPVGEELALCQRYYEVSESWVSSFCPSSTAISGVLFKVRKRINPSVITISQNGVVNTANMWGTATNLALTGAVTSTYGIQYLTTNGATKGEQYVYSFVADAEI